MPFPTVRMISIPGLPHRLLLAALLVLIGSAVHAAPPSYRVDYLIGFDPVAGDATAVITVTPGSGRVQRLRFTIDPERHHGFSGEGRVDAAEAELTWRPPKAGGSLRFRYKVDQERNGGYVARMTEQWALLRIDRLIPAVAVLAPDEAVAVATLRFDLPPGWTNADLGYRLDHVRALYPIDNPGRRFQRPLGWMVAGEIGTRRELIDEMEVSVAAPKGDAMRRNDVLAVVNTLAAEMRSAFGRLPSKLLIVGGGDPFWRGGLSGPNSLFLHADRPLISENGSSTLVHEMVHVLTRIRGAPGDDWIAEGIAEFYSIELLRRAGLISDSRADKAFGWMQRHGSKVRRLRATHSAGPRTARAVTLLKALDEEIRGASDSAHDLDDLVQRLIDRGRVSTAMLREAAEAVLGRPSRVLVTPLLD
jgi:hypothetical protein